MHLTLFNISVLGVQRFYRENRNRSPMTPMNCVTNENGPASRRSIQSHLCVSVDCGQ